MTLEEFLVQTQADVQAQITGRLAEGGWLPAEAAFTEVVMNHLSEIGLTSDPRVLHVERKIGGGVLRLSGYAVSEEADQLDLFVSLWSGSETLQSVTDTEIKTAAEQCLRFLAKAVEGRLNSALDPADDAYELILTPQDCYAGLDQIRGCILTDRQGETKSV